MNLKVFKILFNDYGVAYAFATTFEGAVKDFKQWWLSYCVAMKLDFEEPNIKSIEVMGGAHAVI